METGEHLRIVYVETVEHELVTYDGTQRTLRERVMREEYDGFTVVRGMPTPA